MKLILITLIILVEFVSQIPSEIKGTLVRMATLVRTQRKKHVTSFFKKTFVAITVYLQYCFALVSGIQYSG